MFLKIPVILSIVLVITALLSWKGLSMRKEIPSQEIVPLDKGIAVVSGASDLIPKLQIALYSDDGISKRMIYDDRGICLFSGLSNQKKYTVEVRRTDLKGMLLYRNTKVRITPRAKGAKYFILVGASVGKAWKIENLPVRLNLGDQIVFGNRTKYDFDKSSEIESLLKISIPISGVIIKECAAYFPRNLDPSQKLIKKWVKELRSHHLTPILATTVPVTRDHSKRNPGKFESILEFNDFIVDFSSRENIIILDLEKAVRISNQDRHLKDEYAQADGLHLVQKAYDEALDMIILPVIKIAAIEATSL